jgi:hypothetical protein
MRQSSYVIFAEADYGETLLSAADIAMNSTLAPNISRDPVTAARVPFLKRLPVPLVIFLLSLVIHLGLRPRWLLKFVMCHLLPSLVSIIAFIASVPKFFLLSVFKILPRPQVGSWVSEWARPHENCHLLAQLSARSSSAAPSSVCSFATPTRCYSTNKANESSLPLHHCTPFTHHAACIPHHTALITLAFRPTVLT